MSTANAESERQQQKFAEFLRLLPLTVAIAGLPEAEIGLNYNEGQMEVRVSTLKTAYRLARQMVQDLIK
jgi:hypothetical protein